MCKVIRHSNGAIERSLLAERALDAHANARIVRREIIDVRIGKALGDYAHHRVRTLSGSVLAKLAGEIHFDLAGDVGRIGPAAQAVETVAGSTGDGLLAARGRIGAVGEGRGERDYERTGEPMKGVALRHGVSARKERGERG